MLNILLVDDESRHLRGLKNMIVKLRPHYNIMTASNGKAALEIIHKDKIDIVISDIMMPILNGIELSKEIYESHGKIKVIILSAYGEFEYAQKAIAYGVSNYLLKPVNETQIVHVLNKIEYEIQLEQNAIIEKQNMIDQLEKKEAFYNELQVYKWLNNHLKQMEINELIKKNKICSNKGKVFLFEIDTPSEKMSKDINTTREHLQKLINKPDYRDFGIIPIILNEDKLRIIVIMYLHENIAMKNHDFYYIIIEIKQTIEKIYNEKVVVAISTLVDDISTEASKAYEMAKKALTYSFYDLPNKSIDYDTIFKYNQGKIYLNKKYNEEFLKVLTQLDCKKSMEYIDKFLKTLLGERLIMPQKLKDIMINLLMEQIRKLRNNINEKAFDEVQSEIAVLINQCASLKMMKVQINDIIERIINIMMNQKEKIQNSLFHKCIDYIMTHYNEPLSLESIAEKFYYNPSYFSSQFKNFSGTTFSKFLIGLRIEKSKELLKNTDHRIYEIAEMIGYKDAKYFNRIFKKKMNMTPDEYRRQCEIGK
ncbi:MAG: response regulator [Anaeromicrobium sp.]|jgi:two-component system response regulator YesN|uniref:response regulator transcription factor n=1 Tax=Anaeromicrobium sp. TaxID=1929132 RepID=UPI0025FF523A|nr:response regulator [Anaeromicrobium sp.]MCT4593716.1 response regulator [Anaeromicrobium sp.]